MKWVYLIGYIVFFVMMMCGYEVEKTSILQLVCSVGYVILDRIDRLKKDNNLK